MAADLFPIGGVTELRTLVRDAADVLVDPASIMLTIKLPDGTLIVVAAGGLTRTSAGTYLYLHTNTAAGRHTAEYLTTTPHDRIGFEWDVESSLLDTAVYAPVYATPADYRQVTGQVPPGDVVRKLSDASELVDDLLVGAVYDVDEDTELPTDPKVARALMRAVCQQVRWWALTGDPHGVTTAFPSMSIGSVSLSRGGGAASGGVPTAADRMAPEAFTTLRAAGLLPLYPITTG
ncbi:hypothetical protein [Parafrankia sp. EUN1f]|uniref:hypothetical protein n=1 Tax=Parafrankia sp. EUN1f TaxID=102897 RepID=UPI0001C46CE3|nr:hypothetical protein [Parafrankia sp. EUN1f]EFC80246.1 hypothetical protein FrEUN1fDRAFT_6640 [Parafrankia sp. EUN1f]